MCETRLATVADAELIGEQRHRMFVDSGQADDERMDFPPHWMDAEPVRAYLLNFYVDPAFRGHGLAYALLKTAVGAARLQGIKVVSLHASRFGRPLYKRNGFEPTNEMILRNRDVIR
jgi:GNAT superfamily N-acetyltransferase